MAEPITTGATKKEMLIWVDDRIHEHYVSLMAYCRKERNHNMEMQYEAEQMAMLQALRSLLLEPDRRDEWPFCDVCAKAVEAKGGKLVDRWEAQPLDEHQRERFKNVLGVLIRIYYEKHDPKVACTTDTKAVIAQFGRFVTRAIEGQDAPYRPTTDTSITEGSQDAPGEGGLTAKSAEDGEEANTIINNLWNEHAHIGLKGVMRPPDLMLYLGFGNAVKELLQKQRGAETARPSVGNMDVLDLVTQIIEDGDVREAWSDMEDWLTELGVEVKDGD